ncbi:HPr kinase/phosphorylase [Erythrobacter sp.]|jgi:serine kinase of HPr protein (carbohydrate metabolism regulator)|uniref:HPr kinase/phosphorylase n=1 Tax=Erythrobacter sp. TaxID=1042 RepID=UPI002EC044E2|nr:HPr kinase/phosphatase C-terminal domain-containing protein [Erythrobacter sp.]
MLIQASAVEIGGRAVLVEGPPGSGKSSLALALIDRGARLIGDDGVRLSREGDTLIAAPPPNIAGLLEIRGVGLITLPVCEAAPAALILNLVETGHAERFPERLIARDILGVEIPILPFVPGHKAPAIRAEWALKVHGLAVGAMAEEAT